MEYLTEPFRLELDRDIKKYADMNNKILKQFIKDNQNNPDNFQYVLHITLFRGRGYGCSLMYCYMPPGLKYEYRKLVGVFDDVYYSDYGNNSYLLKIKLMEFLHNHKIMINKTVPISDMNEFTDSFRQIFWIHERH